MDALDDPDRPPPSDATPAVALLAPELARAMDVPTTVVLAGTAALVIGAAALALAPAVIDLAPAIGTGAALWLFAGGAALLFGAGIAAVAFLPPLLLRGADRTAAAVHSWVGARETRRAFGRASRAALVLGSPERVAGWLDATPDTDELRWVRVEALLSLDRIDEARATADRIPARTPFERFVRSSAIALVDFQSTGRIDEAELREAVARIPPGLDRTEAQVSLAVIRARRALLSGDWKRPLLEVRPLIPEGDVVLLTRDFGLTIFELLVRRVLIPIVLLFAALAALLTVGVSVPG
jgi:hypothetical protein